MCKKNAYLLSSYTINYIFLLMITKSSWNYSLHIYIYILDVLINCPPFWTCAPSLLIMAAGLFGIDLIRWYRLINTDFSAKIRCFRAKNSKNNVVWSRSWNEAAEISLSRLRRSIRLGKWSGEARGPGDGFHQNLKSLWVICSWSISPRCKKQPMVSCMLTWFDKKLK